MTNVQICPQCSIAATGAETEPKCRVCGTLLSKESIMGSRVQTAYNGGRLAEIIMYSPRAVYVGDLRDSTSPFVSIDADDGEVSSKHFLDPKIAESLTKDLLKLFPRAAESVGIQFAAVPFAALAACEKIADHLGKPSRGLQTDEHLAIEVLKRACRAQLDHDNRVGAGM